MLLLLFSFLPDLRIWIIKEQKKRFMRETWRRKGKWLHLYFDPIIASNIDCWHQNIDLILRWSPQSTNQCMDIVYRHTLLYCPWLYCTLQILYFLQIEDLWQLWVKQVYQCNFPTTFAHFMSVCHILVILTIHQTFSLLYLLWLSVISDFWCYYHNWFWAPQTVPI